MSKANQSTDDSAVSSVIEGIRGLDRQMRSELGGMQKTERRGDRARSTWECLASHDVKEILTADDERCPVVAGRRLIPEDYIPVIEAALLLLGRRTSVSSNSEEIQ